MSQQALQLPQRAGPSQARQVAHHLVQGRIAADSTHDAVLEEGHETRSLEADTANLEGRLSGNERVLHLVVEHQQLEYTQSSYVPGEPAAGASYAPAEGHAGKILGLVAEPSRLLRGSGV